MTKKITSVVFMFMFVLASMTAFNVASAQVATFPSGCTSTIGFSTTTGLPCNGTSTASTSFFVGCSSIVGFSTITGLPCNGGITATTAFFPGCISTLGTSIITGLPCSGGITALPFLAGCTSTFGFSTITGQPCNGTGAATFDPGITPGLPTTGAGGNVVTNIVLLATSGLLSLFGLVYLVRRRMSV